MINYSSLALSVCGSYIGFGYTNRLIEKGVSAQNTNTAVGIYVVMS